ncbi:MAG: hypothetical protein EZS28_020080 [Streblomastix strix]|uniref:Uncharacterized protein n=1 Tax=Streblomastix strix TaxID=222440 RepID=A0A5J4VP76_9EUKA|nr:MAG: hypothetical protein EZS28_020080 [Streblomastix strix]
MEVYIYIVIWILLFYLLVIQWLKKTTEKYDVDIFTCVDFNESKRCVVLPDSRIKDFEYDTVNKRQQPKQPNQVFKYEKLGNAKIKFDKKKDLRLISQVFEVLGFDIELIKHHEQPEYDDKASQDVNMTKQQANILINGLNNLIIHNYAAKSEKETTLFKLFSSIKFMKAIADVDVQWINEAYNKISQIHGLTIKARSNFDRTRIKLAERSCTPHYIEKLVRLTNQEYYNIEYLPTKVKSEDTKSQSSSKSNNDDDKIDISKIIVNKIDLSEKFQLTDIYDNIYQDQYQCILTIQILFTQNKMIDDTQDISQFNSTIIPMTEAKNEIIEISLTEIDRFCIKYFKQLKVGWVCEIASQYCPESIKPSNFRLQIHKNCDTIRQMHMKLNIRLYKLKEDKVAELEQYVEDEPNQDGGVNGAKINHKLLSEEDCNDHQQGQCNYGMEHQDVESEETDVAIGKKDPISDNGYGYIVTDSTRSWSGEQSSGSTEQDVNEGGLLDQTRNSRQSPNPVCIPCMFGRLSDKNEQTIAKVLQLVSRQRNILSQRTEHELVQPKSLPTSTSQLDSQGTGESRKRQGTCDNHSTGLERSGLIKSIERDESGDVDLGRAEECPEWSQAMVNQNPQIPPGKMKAVRVKSTKLERNCLDEWRGKLGWMEKLLTT